MFIATFALAAFAGVVWYAYDRGLQRGAEVTAPLIKADPRPIKVRPENEGGLQVPNQDKLVFEAMRPGENTGQRVERLLPPPETPVNPPLPLPLPIVIPTPVAPPAGTAPPSADAATATVAIPDTTLPPAPTSGKAAPADIPPARVVAPAPTPLAAPQPQQPAQPAPPPPPPPVVEATPAPQPAPPTQTAARPAGDHRIQLGAFRDEAAAQREWTRLTGRYPELLKELTLRVQSVDLGAGKGVFHRVQAGLVTAADAARICAELKAKGQACLVVRP
ncbi:MAG: SPOR domain-containing protein [Alphaproteobacteria bacterium]|nr:SPOR domain-containing protein [Alphaproteobacteria bacterium]